MSTAKSVRGKVAVVTGAGSGIGRALALDLANRGASIAIADVHEQRLADVSDELTALGVNVYTEALDVRDNDAWKQFANNVFEHFGVVHQLYNNAGIAGNHPFSREDDGSFERIIDINMWGVVRGTRAFLPHLVASGDGHVVNISSLNGLLGYSGLTAYCTSKYAVRGFTEALRVEMLTEKRPVRVTVVHPGGVRTNISADAVEASKEAGNWTPEKDRRAKAYEAKYLKMLPAEAAKTIVDGVVKGKGRILVGRDTRMIDLLVRLLPGRYPFLVASVQRKEAQ
ncbi:MULTISPECIES: SDR family NAD(P)-dependent oxidoreductase [Nocardiaceae]|jgi:NAD(P)-dependent dehydrogenase (short-subunit alcohol dehydrogenase family)|uniref:SDR family NAD(P)-dependent oxidoreductase n=1 Tax=Nocardiaceae TaxID=85025 RepID=UPI00055B8FE8|nr:MULTISPECIES: SDR family oxidoreductase [Rhodococcus]OZE95426.1 NAD(P)-dependent oxidoreductase [Rhodococcus sp. 15-1189-1-1a]OZF10056.1 NAD(P)-dependent oxidoreductase [Rhodococcus sp. 14-2686-1-2]OZF44919.1 NAD(P)-dependent oxidoreductase [Rhodococcus sp. 14-2470-1b]